MSRLKTLAALALLLTALVSCTQAPVEEAPCAAPDPAEETDGGIGGTGILGHSDAPCD
ncbi:MAG: hypothetical protein AAGE18_10240 [Pseudomonadota bacterium]